MRVKSESEVTQSCLSLHVPWTATYQAPPSRGSSRQEYWSGVPLPSPVHEGENQSEVSQSSPTLSDPMDCSTPGSSIQGIFQARVLEWGAIAFSSKDPKLAKRYLKLPRLFSNVLP